MESPMMAGHAPQAPVLVASAPGWVPVCAQSHNRYTFPLWFLKRSAEEGPVSGLLSCCGGVEGHASLSQVANPRGCSWSLSCPTVADSGVTHSTQMVPGPESPGAPSSSTRDLAWPRLSWPP